MPDNKAFQTNFHIFKTGEISLKVTKTLKRGNKFKKLKIAYQTDLHLPIQKRGNHFETVKNTKKEEISLKNENHF